MDKKTVQIVALVLVIGAVLLAIFRAVAPRRTSFDAAAWRSADSDAEYLHRSTMVSDLIRMVNDGTLENRDKIRAVLGDPDVETDGNANTWEYRLGMVDGSSYNSLLVLEFNSAGQIKQTRTMQEVQFTRPDIPTQPLPVQ